MGHVITEERIKSIDQKSKMITHRSNTTIMVLHPKSPINFSKLEHQSHTTTACICTYVAVDPNTLGSRQRSMIFSVASLHINYVCGREDNAAASIYQTSSKPQLPVRKSMGVVFQKHGMVPLWGAVFDKFNCFYRLNKEKWGLVNFIAVASDSLNDALIQFEEIVQWLSTRSTVTLAQE